MGQQAGLDGPARALGDHLQVGIYATDEELVGFVARLRELFAEFAALGPRPDRTRRLLTTVLLPAADGQAAAPDRAGPAEPDRR
ncbi:hypothetical protein ABZ570_32790 [Micromonospora sp. NPDC007271]|uniref:hypothetical protein n=1 Tax=Micromonospora sp. NPDC007271 TaxID=3154587 RepID=UPI0033C9BD42